MPIDNIATRTLREYYSTLQLGASNQVVGTDLTAVAGLFNNSEAQAIVEAYTAVAINPAIQASYATEAEARAGVSTTKGSPPLRVAQSVQSRTGQVSAAEYVSLVTGSGATEDWSAALQALFNASLRPFLPYREDGYRLTVPVEARSDQVIEGNGARVFRDDQNDHIIRIIGKNNVKVSGVSFSHNYDMSGSRNNKSAIYGLNSSNVTVFNCDFADIGLFAISSDVSGDNWIISGNRFNRIGGTAFDARGGDNHLVIGNIIVDTGDDAIDVANAIGSGVEQTVISNNIIVNAGQIHTGGGGIRVNGIGTVVANNVFRNCNMYFVVVAALSTDGTIRPDKTLIKGNVGVGIKPTTNNTTGCVLVKNCDDVDIEGNYFDGRGDKDISISNIVDNGAGKCRYTTATPHGYTTGNSVRVDGVVGVTAANGVSTVTVIDATTFDNTLNFSGAYVSGGVSFTAVNGVRAYTGDNSPARNRLVTIRGNHIKNVEAVLYSSNLGIGKAAIQDNILENYNDLTTFLNGFTLDEMVIQRNRCLNPRRAGLFYGSASTAVVITRLAVNDNDMSDANSALVPIQFASATIASAEALENKMGGATTRFSGATNVAEFTTDGDYSVRKYNQGSSAITAGATEVTVTHLMPVQPRPGEITVAYPSTSAVVKLLAVTDYFSTTFKVKTDAAAPVGGIPFLWRASPVTERYVNGVLAT